MKDLTIEWTTEQKMSFVNVVETLPIGVEQKILERVGVSKRKYNRWVKIYGVTSFHSPILEGIKRVNPDIVNMFKSHPSIPVKPNTKYLYEVKLSIKVGSLNELSEIVTNLQNVPNVHNVNSVGNCV